MGNDIESLYAKYNQTQAKPGQQGQLLDLETNYVRSWLLGLLFLSLWFLSLHKFLEPLNNQ